MNQDASPAPSEAIAPAQPSLLRRTFIGRDGLRAGWSLLIFIAIFVGIIVGVNAFAHKVHPQTANAAKAAFEMPVKMAIIGESFSFLMALFVAWIMSKIERRPISAYGLTIRRKLPHFFAGLGWGVVCLSLLVGTLWKAGLLVIDRRLLFGGDVLRHGAMWLLAFIFVGLSEEYLMRGYLQFTLTRGLAGFYRWVFKARLGMAKNSGAFGFWTSALILSILFGVGHKGNPGESPIGMLSAGLVAMVFCLSLWRTGSLWWAVGFHAAWDWSQSFLYGVADSGMMTQHHLLATHPAGKPILSGGATGPEGSIFIVAILAVATLIILMTLSRERQVYTVGVGTPDQLAEPRPGEAVVG
ncbi:MAG: lysostaphin resistance A-like protein [Terriglobales bacterium]